MNLITTTQAASRLNTNIDVINRWIERGHIPFRRTETESYLIEEDKFDQICQEIQEWLEDEPDDDGVIVVSVQEVEQFWREKSQRQG